MLFNYIQTTHIYVQHNIYTYVRVSEGCYHFFIAFIRHIIYLSNLKYKIFIYNTRKIYNFIYKLNARKKQELKLKIIKIT